VRAFVALELAPGPGGPRAGEASDHLTLEFLGEVASETIPRIVELLRPVGAASAPFDLTVDGVGAFPSAKAPRVVWLGVTEGRGAAEELARRVRAALAGVVASPAEAFVPHVTWFRVRSEEGRRAACEVLEGQRAPPPPRTSRIREFVLKESQLGPRGAAHRTVERFPLGA
jgi:RNA 2',3'-cyclic 3'-phosphodiesterase